MGELMLGQLLFPGESGIGRSFLPFLSRRPDRGRELMFVYHFLSHSDQLVEIIKVLGTPSKAQIITFVVTCSLVASVSHASLISAFPPFFTSISTLLYLFPFSPPYSVIPLLNCLHAPAMHLILNANLIAPPSPPSPNQPDPPLRLLLLIPFRMSPHTVLPFSMNEHYKDHKFPQIKAHPLNKVFRPRTAPDSIDLISHLLQYTPTARLSAVQAMCHPFFDELKVKGGKGEALDLFA
jgi:serine/threonine protein kinase